MIKGFHITSKLDRVVFGHPVSEALKAEVGRIKAKSVFCIVSNSLVNNTDVMDQVKKALGKCLAGVYSSIPAHSPRSHVVEAALKAREARTDLLISIGGGSQIDATKAIQLFLNEQLHTEADLARYARSATQPNPAMKACASGIRSIAVPTTLSGAEFSSIAGILNPNANQKEAYEADDLIPETIILDPDLLCQTPKTLWLSTSVRSLDHLSEGLCSADMFPYLEAQYLAAGKMLSKSLRETLEDPHNAEARMASHQAVWIIASGIGRIRFGASHGIGYVLGALGVPHGHTSSVLLPAVLSWNAQRKSNKQHLISEALECPSISAAQAIKTLITVLGQPTRLEDIGLNRSDFDKIAKLAVNHPVVQTNPRPITDIHDIHEILSLAE